MEKQCSQDEDQIRLIMSRMEKFQGRTLQAFDVSTICEKLWLALLVDSEDMSYHWKYQELQRGEVTEYCKGENGILDKDKFIKWWFMDIHQLFHKNDPPHPEEQS